MRKEREIRKKFVDKNEHPKILIVTQKLLTGFDAPILYCIYLDKPMRDHVLLQAIARVNRPYEDNDGLIKPYGFVLDLSVSSVIWKKHLPLIQTWWGV